ncbi:transposase [Streptosporangium sp. NPDC005286]|uniref:transposase n=1 Tax=Streptosporangium sp. NPDC005286 TaxID=3154463 RepID=UPI0033A7D0EA
MREALGELRSELDEQAALIARKRSALDQLLRDNRDPELPAGLGAALATLEAAGLPAAVLNRDKEDLLLVIALADDPAATTAQLTTMYETLTAAPNLFRHVELSHRFAALADGGHDPAELDRLARLHRFRARRPSRPRPSGRPRRQRDGLPRDHWRARREHPRLGAVRRAHRRSGESRRPPDPGVPRREMAARLATPAGRNLYKRRSALVEPGFAQLFQRFGRHLNYRGTAGVDTEIKLLGAVHNLNKLFLHAKNTS